VSRAAWGLLLAVAWGCEAREVTPGGSEVMRHEKRVPDSAPPTHSAVNLEAIQAHVAGHIGKIDKVLHEIVSDGVHIDVLVVPASDDRPYHLLVTSGISDQAMKVPEGL